VEDCGGSCDDIDMAMEQDGMPVIGVSPVCPSSSDSSPNVNRFRPPLGVVAMAIVRIVADGNEFGRMTALAGIFALLLETIVAWAAVAEGNDVGMTTYATGATIAASSRSGSPLTTTFDAGTCGMMPDTGGKAIAR